MGVDTGGGVALGAKALYINNNIIIISWEQLLTCI